MHIDNNMIWQSPETLKKKSNASPQLNTDYQAAQPATHIRSWLNFSLCEEFIDIRYFAATDHDLNLH